MRKLQREKKQQQSAIAELEAGKGLTAKTLRKLLDDEASELAYCDGNDAGDESSGSEKDDDDYYGDSDEP